MTSRNPGVEVVIEALAVYRATRLLQQDDLPPLPQIREKLMQRYGASPWSALLDCPWCLSVWTGAGLLALRRVAPRIHDVLVRVLASSAVTGMISEWLANMELPEIATEAVESMERATETLNRAAGLLSTNRGVRPSGAEEEAARMRGRLPS